MSGSPNHKKAEGRMETISEMEAARIIGVDRTTLIHWRAGGKPAPPVAQEIARGGRGTERRYCAEAVARWAEARNATRTYATPHARALA